MTTPAVPHRVEHELTVPGTPALVWRAVATAYVEREQPRWQTWLDTVAADVGSGVRS